jgi:hypothetical protein
LLEHDRLPEPDPRPWVRITTFDADSSEQLQLVMRFVADQVVPVSRETPGWKGLLGLTSADGRRGLTLTFWDSLETLVGSSRDARAFYRAEDTAGVDIVSSVERLEVIMDERPE